MDVDLENLQLHVTMQGPAVTVLGYNPQP